MDMINFNVPPQVGTEINYIKEAARNHKICGDGAFTAKCHKWLKEYYDIPSAYLTTSGTSALEMAALLCDIKEGDEVLLPSFTFCSTADAFVQRGAKLVFCDIRPDTMNIDEQKLEDAVTDKTRVIVPVHYAGVGCEMDTILDIAKRHGLKVVEDAAQAIGSRYKGRLLGRIGDYGCLSFHETKNISMGEGGAILLTDANDRNRAEIIREKGTDRSRFFRGEIDKYTWQDYGSSYLPSDINAAWLYGQLEAYDRIQSDRMSTYLSYEKGLKPLAEAGLLEIPYIPDGCEHNAHMFYIKLKDDEERSDMIKHLRKNGVHSVFHYLPLHSSPAGRRYGRFHGTDEYTTRESLRILRLPLYYGLKEEERQHVIESVRSFFGI